MLERVNEEVVRVPARMANAYLVQGDNGLVLVDTGLPGSEKRINKALEMLGKRIEDVKLVLLTHRHLDHIGSVAAVKHASPSTMLASHPFEKPYIAGTLRATMPPAWSIPARISRRLAGLASWMTKALKMVKYNPIHVDRAADDDSILEKAGIDGTILWTPGHTKGSVTLFLNRTRTAIVGDLLRNKHGKLVEPSLMENISQTDASVQRVLDLNPSVICPGHGDPQTADRVRIGKRKASADSGLKKQEKKEKEEDLDLDALARDLTS